MTNKVEKFLPQSFFRRDTELVARDLLGIILVRELSNGQILKGIIVETEAYTADDPACHAFRGKTASNAALFGPVGHAYVYLIYGMHFCFNVVSHTPNQEAGGVLIRGVEPVEGIETMMKNRKIDDIKNLTNGPGKVAQAFGISRQLSHHTLMEKGPLYLVEGEKIATNQIVASPRIGISKAQEMHRRFYIRGNPFVSL